MEIDKTIYISNIKKFSKLVSILESFFENKDYNKENFLYNLRNTIKKTVNQDMNNKRLTNLLISYHKFNSYFNKINKLKYKLDNELCTSYNQNGGFFFNKYDNKYMKSLNTIDFLFDIINLIPNKIISKNNNNVTMPYGVTSLLLNLFRNDYDFAFYSFLGIIPGIGGILGSSLKVIHRIIRFIINKNKIDKVEKYYKQIQAARRVHEFVKDEKYEQLNNPYIGDFENNYNYKEIEDLYLK